MMLEKIKGLENLNFISSKENISKLGFDAKPTREIVKANVEKGRWNYLVFGSYFDDTFALKVDVNTNSLAWPAYEIDATNVSYIYCPNILAFIIYRHFHLLKTRRKTCIKYKAEWEFYYSAILPIFKYYGGTDDLLKLKEIVLDESYWPKKDYPRLPEKDFVKFMTDNDQSNGAKAMFNLIKQADKGLRNFLTAPASMGVWETRIKNIIGARARIYSLDHPFDKVEPLLFECFIQPHGQDAEPLTPRVFPSYSATSRDLIWDIVNSKLTVKNLEHSIGIIEAPEYKAALAIMEQGKFRYTGLEHMEAAVTLDCELNEPVRAWNCLISAGYWAAMNKPALQEVIMETALYLCRTRNWTEAAEAVQYNLDIYKSV